MKEHQVNITMDKLIKRVR